MIFTGSGVALSTPFTDQGVDYDTFEKLIEFQIENGSDALIVLGTTGEPCTMSEAEKAEAIQFVVRQAKGRIPVIAGVGGNCTQHCIDSAKQAHDLGANGVLAVTPYYNKCTSAGMIAHFTAIADATPLSVVLYNVPSRTGNNMTPAVFRELCQHQNISAVKEASGSISQIAEFARIARGTDTQILSGNDDQVVPLLSLGGTGVISVLANIMPRYMHDMVESYLNGNTAKATQMQLDVLPLANALFVEVNPIPVKTALRQMGFAMGTLRLPLCEMAQANLDLLLREMKAFDLV